ncbi:MAG: type VI secretion system baseplate subunit TssF [Candidatus Eisenbacteria bacterium]
MLNKYYQDELIYLRELGEEFARAHPTAAHMLAGPGADPDVERLLEGFAFLSARIREKLDDELPEVTHGLMALLAPHYLRPVPAATIVEFQPILAALRQSRTVPRGIEVQSVPVEGTPCRFRTAFDVTLSPLSLDDVRIENSPGRAVLILEFRLWNQARPETLDLRRVRLHLHGDPGLTYPLYHELRTGVAQAAALRVPADPAGPRLPLTLATVGFADEQALLEYPARSFSGYRLLQEYFALPQKFLFLDLVGLERLAEIEPGDRFRVEIGFDHALPASLRPGRDEIRLYCTPAVNLFPHEADPFHIDRTRTEYRLRPSGKDASHYEIYSVDGVTASIPGNPVEQEIPDFHSFTHAPAAAGRAIYYSVRLRPSVVDERTDAYLAFVDAPGAPASLEAETVNVRLTCSNRRLPEGLRAGDIHVPTDSSPEFVKFRNLAVPIPSLPAPLDGDLHWRLLSHLALNYLSVTRIEALRGVLSLYNFQNQRDAQATRANTRRLQGITAVHAEPEDLLVKGSLVRGTAITLELREDHFAGAGDLYLFASVLNEFFALYAGLNTFTRLTVRETTRGEVYRWPPQSGRRFLI